MGWRWIRGPEAGKTRSLGNFGQLDELGELGEHGDVSMNSLGY
jgi:hypothetical protein